MTLKMRKLTVALFALALSFSAFTKDLSAREKVVLGVGEFAPYISQNLPDYGFMAKMVAEAFDIAGFDVEYQFVPWNRAIVSTESGEMDGTPGWYKNPEREEKFYISDPLVDDSQSLFHLKTLDFNWKDIADLKGIKIGGTLGYSYGDDFDEAVKSKAIEVEWAPSDPQNFRKLLAGRITLFPMNTIPGVDMMKKELGAEADGITYHPTPLRSQPLHLLMSRAKAENERVIELFNSALKEIKESGRYSEYLGTGPSE